MESSDGRSKGYLWLFAILFFGGGFILRASKGLVGIGDFMFLMILSGVLKLFPSEAFAFVFIGCAQVLLAYGLARGIHWLCLKAAIGEAETILVVCGALFAVQLLFFKEMVVG